MNAEFLLSPELIHLNHAGVGPWPRRTAEALKRFADENLHQGSRHYPHWLEVEQRLRERLGRLVGAPASDISLLKSTSEGLSLVAHGLPWKRGENVVFARQEFPSNRVVWQSLERYGVEPRMVDLGAGADPEGALLDACDADTRLLAVSAVQYADGLRMDLERLGTSCRARGILFCIDAIQQLGALRFDADACHADFVVADGHKWMLGPEGLALFYSRPEARERLNLLQYGWHMLAEPGDFERLEWQPAADGRRFECGSPNLTAVHALEASLSLLEELGMEQVETRVLENSARMVETIDTTPELELISARDPRRRSGIVTFQRPGFDSARLYRELMAQNVLCAQRAGGVRFSPHYYTSHGRIVAALERAAGRGC